MTTTPQTVTLAREDYVVIPRDEYERLRAATNEDAADVAAIQRVLDDLDETWAPPEFVRRIVELPKTTFTSWPNKVDLSAPGSRPGRRPRYPGL